MNNLENDNELVSRYLLNQLSEEERLRLEQRMKEDVSLRIAVEEARLAHDVLISNRLIQVEEGLTEIMNQPKPGSRMWLKWLFGISFTGVCFMFFGIYLGEEDDVQTKILESEILVEEAENHKIESEQPQIAVVKENISTKAATSSEIELGLKAKHMVEEKQLEDKEDDSIVRPDSMIEEDFTKKVYTSLSLSSVNNIKSHIQEKIDPCAKLKETPIPVSVKPKCIGLLNGELKVGAVSESQLTLWDGSVEVPQDSWGQLDQGAYSLLITFGTNCDSVIPIEVAEVACKLKGQDYTLYLSYDNELRFEGVEDRNGKLFIYNQGGQVVKTIAFNQYETPIWDIKEIKSGQDFAGFYPYVVKFEDGGLLEGGITVIP